MKGTLAPDIFWPWSAVDVNIYAHTYIAPAKSARCLAREIYELEASLASKRLELLLMLAPADK